MLECPFGSWVIRADNVPSFDIYFEMAIILNAKDFRYYDHYQDRSKHGKDVMRKFVMF